MKHILIKLILFFLLTSICSVGQHYRETRAVWLTTNFKLDWPPNTFDEEIQKQSLREIFRDLQKKNFNTVYFQVRSNGTVLYNSNIEPFSPYLTGSVGVKPNYDPLQFAIELGKEFNLEVHAWVNMIRCFSGGDDIFLKHPMHVRNAHPDWTTRVMGENGSLSYWLNPGYFKVQDYLVELLNEIVSNYDVDGIHLDFFRYPGKIFEDEKYFKSYGFEVSIADWRRNNLTSILRKFKERAKPINEYLKVGATPIGIRKSLEEAVGWEGYSSVFQDTETWLKEGLVDYLTPQIYWNLTKNPRFDVLANDWVEKSYDKNIILGLAAYKPDVKVELNEMIEFSRKIDAAGISFFRYDNISANKSNFFKDLVFPTNMPWKVREKISNTNSIAAKYNMWSNDEIIISWNDSFINNSNNTRNYVLLNETKPIKLLGLDKRKVKLKFGRPSKLMYNYSISRINRLWNHESLSNQINIEVPYLADLKKSVNINLRPIVVKNDDNITTILIHSPIKQSVLLEITNKENIGREEILELREGQNLLTINENLKLIATLKITYLSDNQSEEINFL